MVMKTIGSLEEISRNFTDVKDKAKSFAAWANEELERNDAPDSDVVENELPLPRTRRQMLSDGTVSDQEIRSERSQCCLGHGYLIFKN